MKPHILQMDAARELCRTYWYDTAVDLREYGTMSLYIRVEYRYCCVVLCFGERASDFRVDAMHHSCCCCCCTTLSIPPSKQGNENAPSSSGPTSPSHK